jgi:hypothetical protein
LAHDIISDKQQSGTATPEIAEQGTGTSGTRDRLIIRWAILGGSAKRPEKVCKMAVSAKGALEFRKF